MSIIPSEGGSCPFRGTGLPDGVEADLLALYDVDVELSPEEEELMRLSHEAALANRRRDRGAAAALRLPLVGPGAKPAA